MNSLKQYTWFLLLLLCSGCIKELNFELGKQDDLLVVYGILTDQPGKHLFRVTRTNAFERQVDSEPISGATLMVVDSKAQQYPFVELSPGFYLFKDTLFQASAGERYYLEIDVPNQGRYRSDIEVMPTPVPMDSAYPRVKVKDFDQTLQVMADVQIPSDPTGIYLRWDVTRVWRRTSINLQLLFNDFFRYPPPATCYMTESIQPNTVQLFGSRRRDAFKLREQVVANIEPDYKFFERNAFAVVQYRISEKAYEYWNNLNKIGNPAGTIFDVPPASVRGNIYNVDNPKERILGYFEVAAVDTSYTYTDLSIFRYYIADPCSRDFSKRIWESTYFFDPECTYCTNIKGHSLKVPKFW
ncbi:MAG TPA: DUF4249 domain-containing protein [Haliscomenobacter sp.]|uniref:DUF4249 domain-containing protein n=1 Tax=Haliscomenobacter sp. TaxID=2717303 RepID=UPI002BE733AD|nr:DUF4249 domain-containing protein [Haliscomenobacter sp.]HOY19564.1 DUF4249 domain-containing protein [Haliscomenobacter sp.]